MATMITSQRYLDDAIIAAKKESEDFTFFVSPEFEIDGERFCVVLDGHHSFAAAKEMGIDPVRVELDSAENDNINILQASGAEAFLSAVWMGDDYYNIDNGINVF